MKAQKKASCYSYHVQNISLRTLPNFYVMRLNCVILSNPEYIVFTLPYHPDIFLLLFLLPPLPSPPLLLLIHQLFFFDTFKSLCIFFLSLSHEAAKKKQIWFVLLAQLLTNFIILMLIQYFVHCKLTSI